MKFYIVLIRHTNFGENFSVRDESLTKKRGYYSIENIDDPCAVTIAVNPKNTLRNFKVKT